jgi:Zn-dependent protease
MDGDIAGAIHTATTWVLPVLFAITLHEAAHGWAAWKLGDDTAHKLGRVTFNPFAHIDRFGTILLPLMLFAVRAPFMFGYAKPVPVRFNRLRRPRRDMVLVAAAGPLTNLLLATFSAALLHVVLVAWGLRALVFEDWPPTAAWLALTLHNSVILNLLLAVFNMLPLPPLDGGRVAVGLLPRELGQPLARLERYGMFILLGLLVLPFIGSQVGLELNVLQWIMDPAIGLLRSAIYTLVGLN